MERCPTCGASADESDAFCRRCGLSFKSEMPNPEAPRDSAREPSSSGRRIVAAVVAMICVTIIGFVLWANIQNWESRDQYDARLIQSNEGLAYTYIQMIASSIPLFQLDKGRYPISLDELVVPEPTPRQQRSGIISPSWAMTSDEITGRSYGYQFAYSTGKDIKGKVVFQIVATPLKYGVRAKESFYIDQTGKVGFTCEDRPATDNDTLFTQGVSKFCQ